MKVYRACLYAAILIAVACLLAAVAPMMSQPLGSTEKRLLPVGSTATAQALTAGRASWTTIVGTSGNIKAIPLSTGYDGPKTRGLRFTFMSTGADNSTGTAYIWLAHKGSVDELGKDDYRIYNFGVATLTMGTSVGQASGSVVLSTERLADTIVWTVSTDATTITGPGKAIETAFGSSGANAYSPANNTIAELYLPDVGNADYAIVELVNGTTTRLNCTYELITN